MASGAIVLWIPPSDIHFIDRWIVDVTCATQEYLKLIQLPQHEERIEMEIGFEIELWGWFSNLQQMRRCHMREGIVIKVENL